MLCSGYEGMNFASLSDSLFHSNARGIQNSLPHLSNPYLISILFIWYFWTYYLNFAWNISGRKLQKNQQSTLYRRVSGLLSKGNNKITELRTILQRESQNS